MWPGIATRRGCDTLRTGGSSLAHLRTYMATQRRVVLATLVTDLAASLEYI
jgi:hypothetical protein